MTSDPHVSSNRPSSPLWMKVYDGAELVAQGLLVLQRDLLGRDQVAVDSPQAGAESMRRVLESEHVGDAVSRQMTDAVAAQMIRHALSLKAGDRDAAAVYLGLTRKALDQRIYELEIT